MASYIDLIATQIGAPIWLIYLILVWTAIWKLLALWKSARNKHIAWFIVLGVVNTIGILPILYIYVFSKLHHPSFKKKEPVKRKVVRSKTKSLVSSSKREQKKK